MHQHPFTVDQLQAVEHRIGSFDATDGRQQAGMAGHWQCREKTIIRRDGHHHSLDARVSQQSLQCMFDQKLARQRQILFGATRPHPAADAGCRNHNGKGQHRQSLLGKELGRLFALPSLGRMR